jgi:hypothetical protein
MKAVLITEDNQVKGIDLDDEDILQGLYKAIDCSTVQAIDVGKCTFWLDEEGKFDNEKSLNKLATLLTELWPYDCIIGNVVVTGQPDTNGKTTAVPDLIFETLREIDIERSWTSLVGKT